MTESYAERQRSGARSLQYTSWVKTIYPDHAYCGIYRTQQRYGGGNLNC